MRETLLEVKNLKTYFNTNRGLFKAVDGVNLTINRGETVALVGESGSGKSMTSMSIMKLIESPGEIVDGEIIFEGQDLVKLTNKEMNQIRGNQMAMIFQEPMTSLNPVYTIGNQIMEPLRQHQKMSKNEALKRTVELLELVGFANANRMINQYPHQLSGGMRQRVMIAMAMSNNPSLLIADEPTTALDVTIQAQILDLMIDLKKQTDTSMLLITHDLGVVAEMADRVMVMYAGQIVEDTDVLTLFKNPQHPYTKGLIASMPNIDSEEKRLKTIKGMVPSANEYPSGCRFASRCPYRQKECDQVQVLTSITEGHKVRCVLATKEVKDIAATSGG
ncbi:ABC transporter ATP-binding protein [Lederbergia panacisoli]|uniref:ABC transporter ATP-binding protein n=1 Tax=Lederbergia panacisoli TaxID=1255251 RepID=UPI00214AA111|nr:ABC transporter ATP-binding protein [Lederbergia panacisoli]MCR2820075.1 ABC transporter ATP-binding protein [Lederbergia panacisoli]